MRKPVFPYLAFFSFTVIVASCNPAAKGIFAKKTAREKYEDKIEKLATPEARAWKNAGVIALQRPITVKVPYAENGIFNGDSTDAVAFSFNLIPGQKVTVDLDALNGSYFTAFTELWEITATNERKLLTAADTLTNFIEHTAPGGGNFMIRIQPQLRSSGGFLLTINTGPMLGFPVIAGVKTSIGSLWGDARDAGVRKHEGIDIFAKKGSLAVAVADGTVDRVTEGGIGGKVVWLSPRNERFSVYYAHLDSQLVQSGQSVTKGQPLGMVGNTGNARFTAAHLHFGIYTGSGAVNPIGFVQTVKPHEPVAKKKLQVWYTSGPKSKLYPAPVKKDALKITTPLKIKTVSYNNDFYRVVLENGTKAFIASGDLNNFKSL